MLRRLATFLILITVGFMSPDAFAEKKVRSGSLELDLHFGGSFFLNDDDGLKDTFSYGVGVGFNFTRNLGAQFDFEMAPSEVNSRSLFQFHVDFVYHPITHKWFVPFLGVGPSFVLDVPQSDAIDTDTDPGVNVLVGFDIYPFEKVGIRAQARYIARFGTGDGEVNSHDLLVQIGLVVQFGGAEKKTKLELDTDGDGILDKADACPKVPGVPSAKGCPDADGDTVADTKDKCPKVPGPVVLQGCPDTDKDGLIDKNDRCPKLAGTLPNKGCPDGDKDTIVDLDDRCPRIPGEKAYQGCPPPPPVEVVQAFSGKMDGIFFEYNKAAIQVKSHPVLDKAVAILKKYPHVRVEVAGHTSAEGTAAYNQTLSERRAKAVVDYLISKGISKNRLKWKGYGSSKPIPNAKKKKQNRRMEFRVLRK